MKQISFTAGILASLALILTGCQKKTEAPAAASSSSPAPTESAAPTAAPAAASTEQDEERAKKQALLDYATMEDTYINDPKAQWASDAKASSTFGDDNGEPAASNLPKNVIGPLDGKNWTNNKQDVGMDTLEVSFAKPVPATEVRVVFDGDGVEAVSKLELQDSQGKWNVVWSGLSDVKRDSRGSRTWFVRKFEKTAYPVSGAKITIANNVERGYKVVDAVQLVGE
jgi:hypothetical protein